MDDFTVTGPPEAVFQVFDRFVDLVGPLGIAVNTSKTKIQQAAGEPSELTVQLAADRGLEVVCGNHKCLGGLVGVDDQVAVAWLEAKLAKQTPVTRALRDSRFPSLLALQLAKISNIPKPMYLLRAMPARHARPSLPLTSATAMPFYPDCSAARTPSLLRHLSL